MPPLPYRGGMFVYTQAARECCLELTEPAQDPSSRADDVLHWVGPGGAQPFSSPLDPGASCPPAGKV